MATRNLLAVKGGRLATPMGLLSRKCGSLDVSQLCGAYTACNRYSFTSHICFCFPLADKYRKYLENRYTIAGRLDRYSDGLGGRRFIPGRGKKFFSSPQRPDLQPPIQWIPPTSSPGVKWQEREADHSSPSSAKVMNIGDIPPLPQTSSLLSDQLIKHRETPPFFIKQHGNADFITHFTTCLTHAHTDRQSVCFTGCFLLERRGSSTFSSFLANPWLE
jgi:hypothetical protein